MMTTWERVMALKGAGVSEAKGFANTLSEDDRQTIYATIDFFGGSYQQDIFDLKIAQYRVFDWLAMRIQGRHSGSENDKVATQVLVYSFLKAGGVPSKFIDDLRVTDYQIVTDWEEIEL